MLKDSSERRCASKSSKPNRRNILLAGTTLAAQDRQADH
jgi:hypothetical protein